MRFIFFLFCLLLLAGADSWGLDSDRIEAELELLRADPEAFMERTPPKETFGVYSTPESSPLKDVLNEDELVDAKDLYRRQIMGLCQGENDCARMDANFVSRVHDRIEDFIDPAELRGSSLLKNPQTMDKHLLQASDLENFPWSDSYWPIYRGQVGNRYGDDGFRGAGKQWISFYNYIRRVTFWNTYRRGDETKIDRLSPAEKYDLLIGDLRDSGFGYLTPPMWKKGAGYYRQNGSVATWMGLCHGWAPASFMLPRPVKGVEALAADGRTRLYFYPSDLKALASLVWANAPPRMRFLGSRCRVGNPRRDRNGRIIDEKCFDTNPGNWHMAIVNQIGLAGRNLIMDATFDREVWNHPIYAYEYTYFNPQTMLLKKTYRDAVIPISSFTRDRFRTYRSPEATSVVGVAMEVYYVVETAPWRRKSDDPRFDRTKKVRYFYDLELARDGRILGGEWYQAKHPDFLWVPGSKGRAWTKEDARLTGRWRPGEPLPAEWRSAAREAAQKSQPLAHIIEALLQEALEPL